MSIWTLMDIYVRDYIAYGINFEHPYTIIMLWHHMYISKDVVNFILKISQHVGALIA